MKKKLSVIKGVISYILALMLAIIFALYISANVGWFILIALILALGLSVFFACLSRKMITVQFDNQFSKDSEVKLLAKGEWYEINVIVKNKSIFPTTPIGLEVLNGEGIKSDDKNIIVSVMPLSQTEVKIRYKASICGPARIGINKVKVTDYLGILSLELKNIYYEELQSKVAVIPDIGDVSVKDDRIIKVMQISMHADDSEDTVEATINTFGGFPGYDSREYVPGDPIKRINWKQSAKRDKLLVRLDDEIASQSVSIVLDSVYKKSCVNPSVMSGLSQYKYCLEEDIIPKIAEEAIENVLGIAKILILSNYKVDIFVAEKGKYKKYSVETEKDIESVRVELAHYTYSENENISRFPDLNDLSSNGACVYSTPNDYNDAYMVIEESADMANTSIFSVIEEAKNNGSKDDSMYFANEQKNKKSSGVIEKVKSTIASMTVPVALSFVLSITIFSAFRVSALSWWTLLQLVVCIMAYFLCRFTEKHKLLGKLVMVVVITLLLSKYLNIVFSDGKGMEYIRWFTTGGDYTENTTEYLLSLVMVFTMFFSLVIYFYLNIYYRTSALLFVSLIPCAVYAKIAREIDIKYVMIVVMLNMAAFLINNRRNKDKGKRIVAYKTGLVSVVFYGILFVLLAVAIPRSQETKYYYIFEEMFLGGNTSTGLPDEFQELSEYSGNADGFNQLNNRKLYTISGTNMGEPLYLKRQVFDYYDYKKNRWYGEADFSKARLEYEGDSYDLSTERLVEAMLLMEERSPGFLERYGMEGVYTYESEVRLKRITIKAHNFSTKAYVVPTRLVRIELPEYSYALSSQAGTFAVNDGYVDGFIEYNVEFYEQYKDVSQWIETGGANLDLETSYTMLTEMQKELMDAGRADLVNTISYYVNDIELVRKYRDACDNYKLSNNDDIPKSVKELALDVTKDCKYDWEKAEALERYFAEEGYVYDLNYDAEDDSVEYFLFESKRGTCSDFASAYVLMARAAGLTARYVEGFVVEQQMGDDYKLENIVRTKSAHAYPEVYIQNFGFVVYEPTVSIVDNSEQVTAANGIVGYAVTVGYRVMLVFALVSVVIIGILVVVKVLAPIVNERAFLNKVKKTEERKAIAMIYRRILNKYTHKIIKEADKDTPKEFAIRFENVLDYDISELADIVEKAAYKDEKLSKQEKEKALEIYNKVKQIVKKKK